MTRGGFELVLDAVLPKARACGRFADVRRDAARLECSAKGSAAPAHYRLEVDSGGLWASLVMADRWLSHSIEADLLNTGDKAEELLEEELVELGHHGGAPRVEHFRSEDKLFTFRALIEIDPARAEAAEVAMRFLLAFEACFRRLGDMDAGSE